MNNSPFIDLFVKSLPEEGIVFDIGCGDMRWAKVIKDARPRLSVIGVDKKTPEKLLGIFAHVDAEEVVSTISAPVSGFLFKNVIQFLGTAEATVMLSEAYSKLRPGGVLAIETFWKQPEPGFKKPVESLFTIADLGFGGEDLLNEMVTEESVGLDGEKRTFFLTRHIVRKP